MPVETRKASILVLWGNRAAMHREMPMTHTFPGPARKVWSSVSPGWTLPGPHQYGQAGPELRTP